MTKQDAKLWMRANVANSVDRLTGEVNLTQLAEGCADAFDANGAGGCLDDDTHWVWDVALDAAAHWVWNIDAANRHNS